MCCCFVQLLYYYMCVGTYLHINIKINNYYNNLMDYIIYVSEWETTDIVNLCIYYRVIKVV